MAKKTKRSTVAPTTRTRQSAPANETEYNPFLKVENVPHAMRFAMTGWTRRLRGNYGPQIVVEVEDDDGNVFDFAIGVGSPNHRKLFDALGADETQWGRATLTLKPARGKKNHFVSIANVGSDDGNTSSRGGRATEEPDTDDDIPI